MKKTGVIVALVIFFSSGIHIVQADSLKVLEGTHLIDNSLIQSNKISAKDTQDGRVVLSDETKKAIASKLNSEEMNKKNGLGAFLQNIFSEYWVQFMALVVSLIGVFLAVSGFSFASKNKQKYLKKFLHEIDDAYSSYKWKSKRCEAELYRLKDQVEEQLKAGKIDENTYQLLEKRIDKYLDEIKYAEERPEKSFSPKEREDNAKSLSDQIEKSVEDLK
ncbi:hypothetical protein IT412_02945 [Candidatus Peregrinibacteria bacterium]|nr:hypothetical protein [Candidatus Peregrinibacteria bacterium]